MVCNTLGQIYIMTFCMTTVVYLRHGSSYEHMVVCLHQCYAVHPHSTAAAFNT